LAKVAVEGVVNLVNSRRKARIERTMITAAERAHIELMDLLNKLISSPEGEELLVRALTAAQDSALDLKIESLASALAAGALAADAETISAETLFVRTVGVLDAAHLHVLELFVEPPPSGPLMRGKALGRDEVGNLVRHLGHGIDQVVAVLTGEGLINVVEQMGGGVGTPPATHWEISTYGLAFIQRMLDVGNEAVSPKDSPE
jgi:hypothetical protein